MKRWHSQLLWMLTLTILMSLSVGCDQVTFIKRKGPGKVTVIKEKAEAPLIVPPGVIVERYETTINNGSGDNVVVVPGATGDTGNLENPDQIGKARLDLEITADDQRGEITPDSIELSGNAVNEGSYIAWGDYSLVIQKEGYIPVRDKITIKKNKTSLLLKYEMKHKKKIVPIKAKTLIEWDIRSEYENEPIEVPESILLDGVEIEYGQVVKTGSQKIEINHPAHEPVVQQIQIPKVPVHKFEAVLTTLPVAIELEVNYDVEPPVSLGEKKVTLTSQMSGEAVFLNQNTKVKPGAYQLRIEKEGYETIDATKRIYPAVAPYDIKVELQAKPVVVNAQVSFDIAPPAELQAHVISFIPNDGGSRQQIRPGGSIKPGRYSYLVEKPGYKMRGGAKDIFIEPSELPFSIEEEMEALPRRLSFDMKDSEGNLIKPTKVIINNFPVSFEDTFNPGEKYAMTVEFDRYQTVEQNIFITPGSGPYVLKVNLVPK